MRPYKVLFLCDDCVASAPVLEALRVSGFRLQVAHSYSQVSAHRGERADVIVILSPHRANAWIARLKLLCRRSRARHSSVQRARGPNQHAAAGGCGLPHGIA
jgi:hypothetical protein